MELNFLEILARWGLLAAQSGEPNVEGFQCAEKRVDFAQLAATGGIGLVENAEGRLVFRDHLSRKNVDELQRPLLRHLVAVFVGLREVISRLQEQHRYIRNPLAQEMKDDHIFGLKAAGQTDAGIGPSAEHSFQDLLRCEILD